MKEQLEQICFFNGLRPKCVGGDAVLLELDLNFSLQSLSLTDYIL